MPIFLAFDLQEFASKFGLHTEAFIAHFIAFAIVVAVVVFFGIKPIMAQLEERRKRIEEGEAMHARSEQELADVKATGEKILTEARDSGKKEPTAEAQASGPAFYWVLSQAYFYMSKIGTGSQPYITWPKENTKEAQLAMYNVIVTQGKTVMEKFPSMAGIIATGTTLQNLRTCPFNNNGWDQTRDGYHMDMGTARYGAACTVAGTLFKDINLNKCTFRILGKDTTEGKVCTPVDDSSVSTVVKAARNAIEKPFEITDMSK